VKEGGDDDGDDMIAYWEPSLKKKYLNRKNMKAQHPPLGSTLHA